MARASTKDIQRDVDRLLVRLLTTEDLCRMFKRSVMMIHNYRTREHDPLPVVLMPGRVVGYVRDDVIAWARRNNIHIHETKEGRI
jgi:hypothetical protein